MNAILLAAGVGRRLASLDEKYPKCLLAFEGKSLLIRHLEILEEVGVQRATLVVGYLAHMIHEELKNYSGRVRVRQIFNHRFRRGSVLSLETGLRAVRRDEPVLIMDADVLYHPEVLVRLIESPFATGFLMDQTSEARGEEMMLGVRGGRVWTISRGISKHWEVIGEGVGFFKLAAEDISLLLEEIDRLIAGDLLDADYESAIDTFVKRRPAYYAPVADLPWTEIDFDEDVAYARDVILPAIQHRQAIVDGRNR